MSDVFCFFFIGYFFSFCCFAPQASDFLVCVLCSTALLACRCLFPFTVSWFGRSCREVSFRVCVLWCSGTVVLLFPIVSVIVFSRVFLSLSLSLSLSAVFSPSIPLVLVFVFRFFRLWFAVALVWWSFCHLVHFRCRRQGGVHTWLNHHFRPLGSWYLGLRSPVPFQRHFCCVSHVFSVPLFSPMISGFLALLSVFCFLLPAPLLFSNKCLWNVSLPLCLCRRQNSPKEVVILKCIWMNLLLTLKIPWSTFDGWDCYCPPEWNPHTEKENQIQWRSCPIWRIQINCWSV